MWFSSALTLTDTQGSGICSGSGLNNRIKALKILGQFFCWCCFVFNYIFFFNIPSEIMSIYVSFLSISSGCIILFSFFPYDYVFHPVYILLTIYDLNHHFCVTHFILLSSLINLDSYSHRRTSHFVQGQDWIFSNALYTFSYFACFDTFLPS